MRSPALSLGSIAVAALLFAIALALLIGVLALAHFVLTLPMRRAERARLFLDLLDRTLRDGQPVEETMVSISHSRERAVGVRFHAFAAWLETGLSFTDALARVPRFLPPQIQAILAAGRELGDLRKVLPACSQLLKDAGARTQSATPYLFMCTFLTLPVGFFLYVKAIPKFSEAMRALGVHPLPAAGFLLSHGLLWLNAQFAAGLILALLLFLYVGGPRVRNWLPFLQRWDYFLPWRRKRLQRDFSTMLAILLDSSVPEPEALRLAASCTANLVFVGRAETAVARLVAGEKLPEVVAALDRSGEFAWRLRNAIHARTHFFRALAGWHEALDAKAWQLEQAASTWATTALVLWNGLVVGALVVSVFVFLVSIINAGVLW